MRNRIITIPEPVRQKVAILGAEGLRWLGGLGDLIEELEQEWQVIIGSSLEGGSEATSLKPEPGMVHRSSLKSPFQKTMETRCLQMKLTLSLPQMGMDTFDSFAPISVAELSC